MKFDIDSLRTLQTLADTGNLQATADNLHLSRSAVSWKLKRLQERTLVRRFTPIDTGGTVRVGATEGASATPLLDTVAPWFRRHSADVELKISLEQPATLDEWLTDGRIDLAITITLEDDIDDRDIVLDRDDLVWAHSPGVDFLSALPLPLITWGPRCFFGTLASQLLSASDIDHRVNYELPTIAAVRTALTSGAGIALLNRGVIADTDLTTTDAPTLPDAPRVAYVLKRRPGTDSNPLHDLVIDQIRSSFRPNHSGAARR